MMRQVKIMDNNKLRLGMKNRFIVLLIGGTCLIGCSRKQEKAIKSETKIDTVKVFSLKKSKVEKQTSLPGELLPYERVEIHSKITGYVKQLKVDIGDVVKKGQVLVLIDAPEIESRYGEATGKLVSSKAKYESSLD